MCVLAEGVASRLRDYGFKCITVDAVLGAPSRNCLSAIAALADHLGPFSQ